jgi:hypothetical protein
MHKYIWNIVSLFRWLISSALTYTYTFWLCICFKSSYIWNIVCICRWLVSSALTYTYTCWLCKWFKSYEQVHMKQCISMQMTYIICSNIYLHILTVQMTCRWLIPSTLRYTNCTNRYLHMVYADDLYHLC